MKRLLVFLLLGLFFLSKASSQEEGADYYNDEDEDDADDGDEESFDGSNTLPPQILSKSTVFNVQPGETVRLPCLIDKPQADLVQWFFGSIGLFIDDERLTPDRRLNRTEDQLIISNVTAEDSGNYSCVLATENQRINHTIIVSMPAHIEEFVPVSLKYVWMKGSKQSIICRAKGVPEPRIELKHVWSHGSHKSREEQSLRGNPYVIESVNRHHAGKYTCVALNDLHRSEKNIHIEVDYKPEIQLSEEYINTAEGEKTEMICRVQAHPRANVSWQKDHDALHQARMNEESREGEVYKFVIHNTSKKDFGTYTCTASNKHGSSSRTIRISGEPSRPMVIKVNVTEDNATPFIVWKIRSAKPITDLLLEYKKQTNEDWMSIKKQVDDIVREENDNYLARHEFPHLDPGTYHARVKAKNAYGWSQVSSENVFAGGNSKVPMVRAANTFGHLEAVSQSGATELRISIGFVLSLLAAYLIH